MFDLEVFLYWFCYFNAICTKAIEMAATEMPMGYRYYEKSRTSAADGTSFRGCLSDGDDIFSKSVENQGGANRTFATGGRCHGWQLEPCPYGLEPLLTFRQKIPTGRPYIEEGHSVRHGRSWICFTNSQFTCLVQLFMLQSSDNLQKYEIINNIYL